MAKGNNIQASDASLDELSSSKNLKRNLMYGKVPLNMQMIEEVWLKCDRASGQFQSSELTSRHFNKIPSTVEMIRYAIADNGITLSLNNKSMYRLVWATDL
jgi:hypothetical protein